jgi:SAM-dependent methyltransferase
MDIMRTLLKRFGFDTGKRLTDTKKYHSELLFQKEWSEEFKQNKDKVLEYWERYRCLDDINAFCNFTDDTRVLDVGCGIATVLHYVKGERFGIDPLADEYLKLYEYPEGIHIRKGFGEDIPFPDGYFDVVFCSNVLDHVTNPQKTVHEIHRVLRTGGYFVLTVEIFREKRKRDSKHPHCFLRKDISSLLGSKFIPVFERDSPWIGVRAFIQGVRESEKKELIMVLEKV